tara:strand:- start:852 stop:1133 length:282 start_codon:yes stop_codon:yes gene_type:complete
MRRFVLRIIGFVLLGAGSVVFLLPIPFGLLMISAGLILLIANSIRAANIVRQARIRWPRFDRSLRKAGSRLPRRLHRILAATDPRRRPKEASL